MSSRPNFWKRPLFYGLLPYGLYLLFTIIVGGAYLLAVVGSTYVEDRTLYTATLAEARKNSVYADTMLVEPRTIRLGDYKASFENCWLEEVHTTHRTAWYKPRTSTGEKKVCFKLSYRLSHRGQRLDDNDTRLIMSCPQADSSLAAITQNHSQNGVRTLYVLADVVNDSLATIGMPLNL